MFHIVNSKQYRGIGRGGAVKRWGSHAGDTIAIVGTRIITFQHAGGDGRRAGVDNKRNITRCGTAVSGNIFRRNNNIITAVIEWGIQC